MTLYISIFFIQVEFILMKFFFFFESSRFLCFISMDLSQLLNNYTGEEEEKCHIGDCNFIQNRQWTIGEKGTPVVLRSGG